MAEVPEVDIEGFPGRYWQADDGRINATCAPRMPIAGGAARLCRAARSGDQIVLTTYGRSSGLH